MNALLEALAFLGSPGTNMSCGEPSSPGEPVSPEWTTLSLAGVRVGAARAARRAEAEGARTSWAQVQGLLGGAVGWFRELVWRSLVWVTGPRLVAAS